MIRPIFLFSLPRSGSTLLQRIVAAHSLVHTASEPWLLLPHFYAQRRRGTIAEYSHTAAVFNIRKFCDQLPNGIDDYRDALRTFILDLYSRCCPPGKTHFLDKNPRYALIVDDLLATFPEGRFIFLWRNPLAVIGSNFEMFGHWPRSIYTNHVDLRGGLDRLINASRAHESRVFVMRYEDLLADLEACWES
ncbi:MAG: sulfotransferase family protein [Gammaproteobacteria bacterium]